MKTKSTNYSLFTIHYSLKKGFTLIEIIISLIISAVIGMYIMEQNSKSNFNSDVSKFANLVVKIVETGVVDPTVGFTSGACGGSSGDYTNLSAGNVKSCTGWDYTVGGTDPSDDGTQNYFKGINFLAPYTDGGQGCKIYLDEDGSDSTIFYLFVDCSTVNYKGEARYKKYVEDRVRFVVESALSTIHKATSDDAKSLTVDGGDTSDGMIRFKFQ